MEVKEIPLDKIIIPKTRARATFTPEQEAELRASIQKHGFYIPILVADNGDGTYTLIDGEHRIKIVKEMGWKTIPAVITEKDIKKINLLNILANTARGTQNPMDVAELLDKCYKNGISIKELAAATGHTESWVKLYLTLVELPDYYKKALREGKLKVGHFREAMRLPDPAEVDAALQSALVHDWNVNVMKYYVDQRISTIKAAMEKGAPEDVGPPPTPEQAQEIVQYGDCMFCHRKIPRKELMMPVICPDCRSLLEWLLDQFKDPNDAMDVCYKALKTYFDIQRKQQQPQIMIKEQYQPKSQQIPVQQMSNTNNLLQQLGLDEKDIKLLKILKMLKEAM